MTTSQDRLVETKMVQVANHAEPPPASGEYHTSLAPQTRNLPYSAATFATWFNLFLALPYPRVCSSIAPGRRTRTFAGSASTKDPHRIPDPHDPDPIRYAIIACLVEFMPEVFNFNLSIGMRRDGNDVHPKDWDGSNNSYAP
ncbi:hypothetical protein PAAG_00572 [Paracoccidioides lutzii Pb01]|uniref:Uncharacterized protein n=1 Tax=Paracoccidioides lutzii (strain ATCC MYA-826 / Pb01) TaxID=502779 RepID=C1GPX7_PARBA|nr:hypothetical protein PAAG_00572 [Paracoccidioides lutzii Pb01]EEH36249.2 hypothetical protein PAAG_00572 [Paracoccidioides lutzii Pb01]